MSKKEIQIECPCCHSELTIERASDKIVAWQRAENFEAQSTKSSSPKPDPFEAARDRVQRRESGDQDKLGQALSRERNRERDLDELFDRITDRGEPPEES